MQKKAATTNNSSKKSLSEVLNIFSHIDMKIMDLHNCSSEDFLALNSALKDNYKKAKYINNIVAETFQKIGETGNINYLKMLKKDFSSLQKHIESFEIIIEDSLNSLEEIQANLNMIEIPMNNVIQNLCVLKLLFSNIKLTNSFFDKKNNNFNKTDNNEIEQEIKDIQENLKPFEKIVSEIQKQTKLLYDNISEINKSFAAKIINIIEKAGNDFELIEKHNKKALNSREQIDNLSEQCSKNVESIITNLQYHDIIRQKMEHVQKTHQLIIDELNGLNKSNTTDEEYSKIKSYVIQIPRISEIQTAQLLHANKEFQQAIDQISGKMGEIGQNMSQAARIYSSLAIFDTTNEKVKIDHIGNTCNTISESCNEYLEKFKQVLSIKEKLSKKIIKLNEDFLSIDQKDNNSEQMILERINEGNLLTSSRNETASQAQQVLKLFADNRFEKNKLKNILEQTIEILSNITTNNSTLVDDKHGIHVLSKISADAKEKALIVKENLQNLEEKKEIINQNSQEIIEQNNKAVKKAKYYAYFKEAIDEIIENFNNISDLVKSGKLADIDVEYDENSLKQIEDYYTMKSERIIHNKTITDLISKQNDSEEKEEDKDGNDVEFF